MMMFHLSIESQTALGWGDLKAHPVPPRATRPGCSKPPPAWPWTLPGMGQPQLLWAMCARASPSPQGRISAKPVLCQQKAIPLILAFQALFQGTPSSLLGAPSGTGSGSELSLEPSCLQAELPQLSQPGSGQRGSSPWSISLASSCYKYILWYWLFTNVRVDTICVVLKWFLRYSFL